MRITLDIIKKIYPLAKDVFERRASRYDVHSTLVEDVGMNRASAMMYVQAFLKMMEGKHYTRTINGHATEYFLEMIHADYGKKALKKALSSVAGHIEYYKSR